MEKDLEEYKELFKNAYEEVKKENQNLDYVNLVVAGKSGVGKSTLINSVFGRQLADTGVGKPVTDKITLIEQPDFPVRIYDTVGFELAKSSFDLTNVLKNVGANDIKKLIKKSRHSEHISEHIHAVWYLISGSGSRIEDEEMKLIKWMNDQKLPVIVVLTKSYDRTESELLRDEINRLLPEVKATVSVLARSTDHLEAFGIEELVEQTFHNLPESLQISFIHSQEASLKLKHSEAVKVISMSMAKSFMREAIPFAQLSTRSIFNNQIQMLAKITSIYGVNFEKKNLEKALLSMINLYESAIPKKTIKQTVDNKLGAVAKNSQGLISGGLDMIFVGALGYAYTELMSLVVKKDIDLESSSVEDITELLIELLPSFMPKMK
ncbi:GTPase [Vagococcus lutrae]|uniref:GTPase n=1 Tax=Vagococcus lutrae TaxID=81947 RepID=UPI0023A9DCA7|nr:GTPase domain-containing protein [Vagococcus lutrae]WEB80614.1 GTPase domain-containing protein [Vagococcus lutrae]